MSKDEILELIRDSIVNLDFDKSKEYATKAMDMGVIYCWTKEHTC
jgi:hypothetical protein